MRQGLVCKAAARADLVSHRPAGQMARWSERQTNTISAQRSAALPWISSMHRSEDDGFIGACPGLETHVARLIHSQRFDDNAAVKGYHSTQVIQYFTLQLISGEGVTSAAPIEDIRGEFFPEEDESARAGSRMHILSTKVALERSESLDHWSSSGRALTAGRALDCRRQDHRRATTVGLGPKYCCR